VRLELGHAVAEFLTGLHVGRIRHDQRETAAHAVEPVGTHEAAARVEREPMRVGRGERERGGAAIHAHTVPARPRVQQCEQQASRAGAEVRHPRVHARVGVSEGEFHDGLAVGARDERARVREQFEAMEACAPLQIGERFARCEARQPVAYTRDRRRGRGLAAPQREHRAALAAGAAPQLLRVGARLREAGGGERLGGAPHPGGAVVRAVRSVHFLSARAALRAATSSALRCFCVSTPFMVPCTTPTKLHTLAPITSRIGRPY
jgi:hypothetical protein